MTGDQWIEGRCGLGAEDGKGLAKERWMRRGEGRGGVIRVMAGVFLPRIARRARMMEAARASVGGRTSKSKRTRTIGRGPRRCGFEKGRCWGRDQDDPATKETGGRVGLARLFRTKPEQQRKGNGRNFFKDFPPVGREGPSKLGPYTERSSGNFWRVPAGVF